MMYEEQINILFDKDKGQLSDFQKATVEYLYERMYNEGQDRMLVADEVGLGKTWVAKGLIAKAFESELAKNQDSSFNVFYICSNQQLSAQNLKSLNFTKRKECIGSQVNRISLLAKNPKTTKEKFCIYSLTPDTSFSDKSSLGIKEERLILYSILVTDKELHNHYKRLRQFLKGYYGLDNELWKTECRSNNASRRRNELRPGLIDKFIDHIKHIEVNEQSFPFCYEYYQQTGSISLLELIRVIVGENITSKLDRRIYNEAIGALRKALTELCLSYMEADLFIMDEFQRYSQLIDSNDDSESSIIARKVFNKPDAKILMLSATPFKAYTTQFDERNGEQHYKEFTRVLKFLYEGKDINWMDHEHLRSGLFTKMLSLKNADDKEELLKQIEQDKHKIEEVYSKVIVRTEKLIASNNPDGMTKTSDSGLLQIQKSDIEDFIYLDSVFQTIYQKRNDNAPSPIEYAKSAPYAMSFLRDYKIGQRARSASFTTLQPRAFVDMREIQKYAFPQNGKWPNARLNILMERMKDESCLLWCPPSLCYYKLEGPFKGQERFTKTLVFSAWKMVPKMIATLLSYEAEKQTLGNPENNETFKYFADRRTGVKGDAARKPLRRLVFAQKKRNNDVFLNNMTTLLLTYPSRSIEKLIDPLRYINKGLTADAIINENLTSSRAHRACIYEHAAKVTTNGLQFNTWSIPMIGDSGYDNSWLNQVIKNYKKGDEETIMVKDYLPFLKSVLENCVISEELHQQNEDDKLDRQLLSLALGSPAICAFRALKRHYGHAEQECLEAAFNVGLAFIDLFNKPESIGILDLKYRKEKLDYWQKVIRYCIDGNLQAVLDEYVYMLKNDCEKAKEVADTICKVVSMRTVNLRVDDCHSFFKDIDDQEDDQRHNLRCHYAAAFGINPKSNEASEVRATNIREAFNSPFKPFVLATTSIGQEGLDFHWYCRRIIHWNLPHNPIDFEQREGRINRFRGKVIRQRVADQYSSHLPENIYDPWTQLFELAKQARKKARFNCAIVPDWHFESDSATEVSIERIVPLYQFSQDIGRYNEMLKILGLYRLTFGQPRQEELAVALDETLNDEQKQRLLINLCPLKNTSRSK